jgi:hypothetical protein
MVLSFLHPTKLHSIQLYKSTAMPLLQVIPPELVPLISEKLSLRMLMYFCMACKTNPTAKDLAIALQNAVPSCTGLPVHDTRAEFFLDIAKWYFDPNPIDIAKRSELYGLFRGQLFPVSYNMQHPVYAYPDGYSFFTRELMEGIDAAIFTKKGREEAKALLLEWRAYYLTVRYPGDQRYAVFIDHIICILDHGLVVRDRRLLPGTLGDYHQFISDFEHL